jgi:hypothetical protein
LVSLRIHRGQFLGDEGKDISIYCKDWGGANPSSSITVGRQLRHAGRPALFHRKQWVSRKHDRRGMETSASDLAAACRSSSTTSDKVLFQLARPCEKRVLLQVSHPALSAPATSTGLTSIWPLCTLAALSSPCVSSANHVQLARTVGLDRARPLQYLGT